MPTDTFHNLPAQKRERIAAAVRGELSRVPFPDFSINRIVRAAGISRGSYYQYFTGRDDLYGYVTLDCFAQMEASARSMLLSCGGDVFTALAAAFGEAAAFARRPENLMLCRNLFLYVRARADGDDPHALCAAGEGLIERLRPLIDTRRLRCDSEAGLADAFAVLGAVFRASLTELFVDGRDAAEAETRFAKRLLLLRRGLDTAAGNEEAYTHAC